MTRPPNSLPTFRVAVIGGGPAGLMAAEVLAIGGAQVDLFDAMPSVGRKFLLAGRGGLNLTHAEPLQPFIGRYAERRPDLRPMLEDFGPDALRAWALGLGISTFVGSSGRVFPTDLKAAPLLRSWLNRLRSAGVRFHMRHRWEGGGLRGWPSGDADDAGQSLRFSTPAGEARFETDAVVLALGGASWPRLGSDGAWVPWLIERDVDVAPLRSSNCGFDVGRMGSTGIAVPGWSEHFRSRFAGHPVKNTRMTMPDDVGRGFDQAGEFVVTERGVEGSLVYALSGPARERIASVGRAIVHVDLLPGRSPDFVRAEVVRPRGSRSLSTHLKSRLGLDGVKAALLHELLSPDDIAEPLRLSAAIKALPLTLTAARPIAEAISSAGGVRFEAMDEGLMLRSLPGVFCAGEMLDWEAPTGGYLLTACFATGTAAARGALAFGASLSSSRPTPDSAAWFVAKSR